MIPDMPSYFLGTKLQNSQDRKPYIQCNNATICGSAKKAEYILIEHFDITQILYAERPDDYSVPLGQPASVETVFVVWCHEKHLTVALPSFVVSVECSVSFCFSLNSSQKLGSHASPVQLHYAVSPPGKHSETLDT